MADPFAVEVAVRRFTAWRGALAVLASAAIGCEAAWCFSQAWSAPAQWGAAVMGAGLIGLLIATMWRPRAGVLSCRGGTWYFAPASSAQAVARDAPVDLVRAPAKAGAEVEVEVAVELAVALDLGSFFLFRLASPLPHRAASRWLPVERAGLAHRWQALRCAVYAARPRVAAAATQPSSELAE